MAQKASSTCFYRVSIQKKTVLITSNCHIEYLARQRQKSLDLKELNEWIEKELFRDIKGG